MFVGNPSSGENTETRFNIFPATIQAARRNSEDCITANLFEIMQWNKLKVWCVAYKKIFETTEKKTLGRTKKPKGALLVTFDKILSLGNLYIMH